MISNGGDGMSQMRCSLCGKTVERDGNAYAPFCSERCQQMDLGRWLDERYGLPWEDPTKEPQIDQDSADSGDQNRSTE